MAGHESIQYLRERESAERAAAANAADEKAAGCILNLPMPMRRASGRRWTGPRRPRTRPTKQRVAEDVRHALGSAQSLGIGSAHAFRAQPLQAAPLHDGAEPLARASWIGGHGTSP